MGHLSKLTGGAVALALAVGSIAPAAAQSVGPHGYGYPGRPIGWGGHHRRNHDKVDVGDVVGIAAIFGAIAIIASAASKNRRDGTARVDTRSDDSRNALPPRYDDRPTRDDRGDAGYSGSEDAAVDACAFAARDEGSRDGLFAEVREIGQVRASTDGGWTVTGVIDQKETFRATAVQARSFTCIWRGGQVTDVVLSRETRAI